MTTFARSSLPTTLRTVVLATLLVVGLLTGHAEAVILDQSMRAATAPGWVIGGAAYLTASTGVDPVGDGWLRLTDAANDKAGYGFYDSAFDISSGVVIQFDYATWGGTGADGYSIYLFDGAYNSATFNVGASGGSLGYDKKTVAPIAPGLSGGYIGVGIDEFGNFSSPTEGRLGGPGARPNSVAVRGPYDHPSGAYYYIGGTAANVGTLWFNQAYRPGQSGPDYRKVIIYLTPVAPPNYMRVDVFMQFGYNQPLTYLINTLYTMRPIPSTVKVGYAASTGGSTNVHEIRNLTIDNLPTDINLAMAKTASLPIVAPGGALTYTVTARNYGPNLVTIANNVPIVDTLPVQLTGATWTCVASGGATCGAASGSGNLNTTATLPFNGGATYTISGTVAAGTPLGTVLNNTATLSAPAGITDYNPADNSASVSTTVSNGNITISGTVYNDANHNGVVDGGEVGVNGITYYAKLFRVGDLTTTVVAPVTVSNLNGTYTFNNVPNYGNYLVILSSTNTANVYDPSFPNANWIYVAPLNYTLTGVVASGTNLTNQNFFLYSGSRISGKVIKDDGFNGSISTAYDGILNAAETGIAGVTVTLRNATGLVTHDTSVTDSNGNFTLFTTLASTTLRIYENNPAGYFSVSNNVGTTAGGAGYNLAGDYLDFAYTRYTDYSAILFGDAPTITSTFTLTPLTGTGVPATSTYYAHKFRPTGRGSVVFSTVSRTQGAWPAIAYLLDSNCNGSFDAGEPDIVAAINAEANTDLCILVREAVPAGAVNGTTDTIVTRATFTAGLAAAQTSDVTDTTTVRFPILSTSTKNWINKNGGDALAGDVIRYTITLIETAGVAASNVSVSDVISPTFSNFSVISIPAGATDLSTPGIGPLSVTNISLAASGSVTVVFDVTIPLGTATGTVINNSATITVPGGTGATPAALALIVNGGSLAGPGNKPLYLYDGSSTPTPRKLSRTPPPAGTVFTTITGVPAGNANQIWTENPSLAGNVTISGPSVPVPLYLASTSATTSRIVEVRLYCSSDQTTYATSGNVTLTAPGQITTAPAMLTTFTLTGNLPMTCNAGNNWVVQVWNRTPNNGRNVIVYPISGANYSFANLPSQNVIDIQNSGITFHTAPYNGGTSFTTTTAGSTVYIRALVSDPFGSYDISGAKLTLTDSAGTVKVNAATMTQVFDSNAATKIYEYGPYTVPAVGPGGAWTARVVATEGSEGTVSDYGLAALTVTLPLPSITVLKSADRARVNSGQEILYTIVTSNAGPGVATAVKVIDNLSPFVALILDYDGVTPPYQPFDFTPASSGLTLGTPVYYNSSGVFTPNFAAGVDGTVTRWEIPMTGSFSAGGTFTVRFKVSVK